MSSSSDVGGDPDEYDITGEDGMRGRWNFGAVPVSESDLGEFKRGTINVPVALPSLSELDANVGGLGVAGSASDATDCSESVRSMTSREKRGDFFRGGSSSTSSMEVMLSAGGGSALKSGRKITASRGAIL